MDIAKPYAPFDSHNKCLHFVPCGFLHKPNQFELQSLTFMKNVRFSKLRKLIFFRKFTLNLQNSEFFFEWSSSVDHLAYFISTNLTYQMYIKKVMPDLVKNCHNRRLPDIKYLIENYSTCPHGFSEAICTV